MAPKLMILTGAPDSSSLDWNVSNLLNDFVEPIARFAGVFEPRRTATTEAGAVSVLDLPVWRSLPLDRPNLHTGFSQLHAVGADYHGNGDFFTTVSESFGTSRDASELDDATRSFLSEFYDHTLAVHEDIPSSQLPAASLSAYDESSFTSSLDTRTSRGGSFGQSTSFGHQEGTLTLGHAHLSDLEDLPTAAHVKKLHPQTMSVNLIVGIISIAEPRTVRTRWGSSKSLVELLVGDDTKTGFTITFWLTDGAAGASTDQAVKSLRKQDIVLLRNVGLSEFKDKVHGHSLRKGLTKVDLLYRRRLDKDDSGGIYTSRQLDSARTNHPQLFKTKRVREWVLQFVGGGTAQPRGKRQKARARWEMPPDDTQ